LKALLKAGQFGKKTKKKIEGRFFDFRQGERNAEHWLLGSSSTNILEENRAAVTISLQTVTRTAGINVGGLRSVK